MLWSGDVAINKQVGMVKKRCNKGGGGGQCFGNAGGDGGGGSRDGGKRAIDGYIIMLSGRGIYLGIDLAADVVLNVGENGPLELEILDCRPNIAHFRKKWAISRYRGEKNPARPFVIIMIVLLELGYVTLWSIRGRFRVTL